MSGASERANGLASGPVLTSGFLVDPAHSAAAETPQSVERVDAAALSAVVNADGEQSRWREVADGREEELGDPNASYWIYFIRFYHKLTP